MYIDLQDVENQLLTLKKESQKEQCWAIGECGLDRRSAVSMTEQEAILAAQIEWATEIQKPLVIHCVKAFSELIKMKEKYQPNVAFVVHGFNNNQQIFNELLKNNFYFSFGKAILQEDSNATKALKNIPHNRFLLETDNEKTSIKIIYETTSSILNLQKNELKALIINNLKEIKILL